LDRKQSVTWDDIVEWAVAHPYISSAVVVFVVAGLLMKLAEEFPRFAPVARGIGYIFAIIVGGLALFLWIIPGFDEALAAHSRLENTASVIAVLLGFILLALWHVIAALDRIRTILERNR
jgi:hypothetical protein